MAENTKNKQNQFTLADVSCTELCKGFDENARNGSVVAVAGDDYAIIATDARNGNETNQSLHKISTKLVLASSGDQCNTAALTALLRARIFIWECQYRCGMPTPCIAQLLSCLLTNQRFFPHHVSVMIAGVNQCGKGVVYAYDPLGYNQCVNYRAMGCANIVLQAILKEEFANHKKEHETPPKLFQALEIVLKAFSAAARCEHIYTGDVLMINMITPERICKAEVSLYNDRGRRGTLESWLAKKESNSSDSESEM